MLFIENMYNMLKILIFRAMDHKTKRIKNGIQLYNNTFFDIADLFVSEKV